MSTLKMDPGVVEAAQAIFRLDARIANGLGLDWSIDISVRGRRVANVCRTVDEGITMRFYGQADGDGEKP